MSPPPAITQALTALLPSLPASNKSFPPALVTQCESLLALSRQRASNLKAEEEIARAHACAEIACKRLRVQCRLPAIKNGAGAPCKPRTYTKLITFLEGVLADAPTGSLTPKGRKRDATGSIKEDGSAQKLVPVKRGGDETPSKRRHLDTTIASAFAGKIKKNTTQPVPGSDQVPPFVMPSIRKICKKFSTPSIAPHVYTGTCIILPLANLYPPPEPSDELTAEQTTEITTLIIALYLMVLTRMRKGNMTQPLYTSISTQSLETLEVPATATHSIETWVEKANSENWCNGTDWFASVPEDVLVVNLPNSSSSSSPSHDNSHDTSMDIDRNTTTTSSIPSSEGDIFITTRTHIQRTANNNNGNSNSTQVNLKIEKLEREDPEGVLLPGLGTMLHDGLDYTSEDMKLDYRAWKSKLLRRIAALEKNIPMVNARGKRKSVIAN